jgi:hypothetical protein
VRENRKHKQHVKRLIRIQCLRVATRVASRVHASSSCEGYRRLRRFASNQFISIHKLLRIPQDVSMSHYAAIARCNRASRVVGEAFRRNRCIDAVSATNAVITGAHRLAIARAARKPTSTARRSAFAFCWRPSLRKISPTRTFGNRRTRLAGLRTEPVQMPANAARFNSVSWRVA